MAALDIALKPVDGDPSAAILELTGVLDGSTVNQFQDAVEGALKQGARKLVIDIAKIRYVNSTGLGAIMKYKDRAKAAGGGLALCKVPAKVKIVIEMLGMQAFIELCADERQALEALARQAGGAPPPAAAPSPSYAPPPPPPPPPSFAPPPPPAAPVTGGWGPPPSAGAPLPSPRPAPPPPRPAGLAPVACKSCGVQVEVREPGNWKCPRCGTLIAVKPDGSASFMTPDRQGPYEVSMNVTREGSEALANFVGTLANYTVGDGGAGEAVRQAVGEVVHVIAASAYNFDPKAMVHVSVETAPNEIRVKLADHGKTLDGSQVGAYFPNASRAMNEFECRPHPKGGNVIRMVKRK